MPKYLRNLAIRVEPELYNFFKSSISFSPNLIVDLLFIFLKRYETNGIGKIELNFTKNLQIDGKTEKLIDVIVHYIWLDEERILKLDDDKRKEFLFHLCAKHLRRLALSEGWDKNPVEEALKKSEEKNFSFDGTFGKDVKSTNRELRANLTFSYGSRIILSINIFDRNEKLLCTNPIIDLAGAMSVLEGTIGAMKWTSDTTVQVMHKNGREFWEIDANTCKVNFHGRKKA